MSLWRCDAGQAPIADTVRQSELIEALGGTCPTCGQHLPKKKVCPKCGSENVMMFDADEDFCLTCKERFNGT